MNPEYKQYQAKLQKTFTYYNVTGSYLYLLRENHLDSLGISDPTHRYAIYSNIIKTLIKERKDCKIIESSTLASKAVDEFSKHTRRV